MTTKSKNALTLDAQTIVLPLASIVLMDDFELRKESRRSDTDTARAMIAQIKAKGRPDQAPIAALVDAAGEPTDNKDKSARWTVVAGRSRHVYALEAGIKEMPYAVVVAKSKAELIEIAARENFVRQELTDTEKGDVINRFKAAGMRGSEIAEKLGISQALVSILSKVARYAPENARQAVAEGKLTTHDLTKIVAAAEAQVCDRKSQADPEKVLTGDALAAEIKRVAEKKVEARTKEREQNNEGRGGDRRSELARPWHPEPLSRKDELSLLENALDSGEPSAQEKIRVLSIVFGFASPGECRAAWENRKALLAAAKAEQDAKRAAAEKAKEEERAAKQAARAAEKAKKDAERAAKQAAAGAAKDAAPRTPEPLKN